MISDCLERQYQEIYKERTVKGRHLIEPGNFTIDELDKLFSLAETIMKNPDSYSEVCRGKVLATLFFEPSTRTRLSFEAAMLRLGGSTLGFAEPGASSTSKGESLADTIRTVASYVDIIAMRNPKEGAALLASQYSDVPSSMPETAATTIRPRHSRTF